MTHFMMPTDVPWSCDLNESIPTIDVNCLQSYCLKFSIYKLCNRLANLFLSRYRHRYRPVHGVRSCCTHFVLNSPRMYAILKVLGRIGVRCR